MRPGHYRDPAPKKTLADIVAPDVETHTNERGGRQSKVPVRFDLIDGPALFAMAAVLHEGAEKYGENNWRKIDVEDHLNHLIMHAYAFLSGDHTDDHLSHIMCRAMFAEAVHLAELDQPEEQILREMQTKVQEVRQA